MIIEYEKSNNTSVLLHFLKAISRLIESFFLCYPHRLDCVNSYRQHSLCCRCWSLHDPPIGTSHHGDPNMPSLPLLQAHCCASRC